MPKNAQTTAQLPSFHTLVMLKILQGRLQQYMNRELPDVQAGFKALLKDQGVGGGPYPGNLHPFPKIVGIILPLINVRNCLVYKN